MNEETTLQRALRDLLARLDELGPCSDDPADLDAFGEVKDYLLDQLERTGVPA